MLVAKRQHNILLKCNTMKAANRAFLVTAKQPPCGSLTWEGNITVWRKRF